MDLRLGAFPRAASGAAAQGQAAGVSGVTSVYFVLKLAEPEQVE